MNEQGNNNSGKSGGGVTLGNKIGYISTGVLIGLVAYPFVRKLVGQLQPKMDQLLDNLTGKAEDVAEKASDIFAKAKSSLTQAEPSAKKSNGRGHAHSHDENA